MKPKAEYGPEATLMVCCGNTVCAEVTRDGGIGYAQWTCPECGEVYEQQLGEIIADQATRNEYASRN